MFVTLFTTFKIPKNFMKIKV